MPSVIATKKEAHFTKPYLGYIQPLILEADGQIVPEKVNPNDYPEHDEIFITSDFEHINDFAQDELFRVSFKENDRPREYGDRRWAKFIHDGKASGLERNEYFHLIDGEPDPSKPTISLPYTPTRWLMLHSAASNTLFGPFDYEVIRSEGATVELRLKACPISALSGFNRRDQYSVYKFPANSFEEVTHGNQTTLLANLHELAQISHEDVDFLPDEQLLKLADDILSLKTPKTDLKVFKESIKAFSGINPDFDDVRRQRLSKLLDRLEFWSLNSSALTSEFLKTEQGQAQLDSYLETNKQKVLDAAEKRFSGELEAEQKQLETKVDLLKEEISSLEQDKQKTQAQRNSEQQKELSTDIKKLEDTKQQRDKDLEAVLGRIEIANDIEKLRYERYHVEESKKEADRAKQKVDQQKQELEGELTKVRDQIKEEQSELKKKMRDLKPFVDLLNGALPEAISQSSHFPKPKRREDQPVNANEMISEVHNYLNSKGRAFSYEQVANFLISIDQSFLTVFAGLPGVGKTSLATYLTRALGMSERLLYIPIARGMTSQRDLLGFYNPLTQRFQPASTGLYERLLQQKDENGEFSTWVLLDEANLSPVEHYFSSFLPMCDDDNNSRDIRTGDLGESSNLTVLDSMRFLATINYDNTTEPLSARLIDRVPIIKIEEQGEDELSNTGMQDEPDGLLPYSNLHHLLLPNQPLEFTEDEEALFSKVVNVLKASHESNQGLPIFINRTFARACF